MKSNTPKVSVIVPCYNVGPYVGRCLDSLVNQTLHDIEIICIDDKSTDDTLKILSEYAKHDKRITLIRHAKNAGVAIARNDGMARATGEYIGFVDPDDYLPDEKVLGDLYNAAVKNKVKICGGSVMFLEPSCSKPYPSSEERFTFPKNGIIEYKDWPYDYGFWRFIYNRKWLVQNKIFFPPYVCQEDPVFFVTAMCLAKKFYALKRPSYVYRVNYKARKYTTRVMGDICNGLYDCIKIGSDNQMWELCLNVAKHTNDFAGCIKGVNKSEISDAVTKLVELIADNLFEQFIPAKQYLNIVKKYKPEIYDIYAKQIIYRRRIYLFDFIPIIRIVDSRLYKHVQFLDFFPLLRIQKDARSIKYYMFNILPILKIKH